MGNSEVLIIGGGLSGLVNAILLRKAGFEVCLIEKKRYPFHRVCGEYISNEVIPFLEAEGLFPTHLHPPTITQFKLTSVSGRAAHMELDLGAFGVSRYALDAYWVELARELGVEILEGTTVSEVSFDGKIFHVKTRKGERFQASWVIGAFGKRSIVDKHLNRSFMSRRSPYIGVKYHLRIDEPADQIALHNFEGGYCGISQIEEGKYNLCYLSHRNNLRKHGNIPQMEAAVLHQNPYLKRIFDMGEFLWEKPEVINEISFEPKKAVEQHVLMSGDAAGLITPLCGNGMALAIHSAKILSETLIRYGRGPVARQEVEKKYTQAWNQLFSRRLWAGRQIQRLFGSAQISDFAVDLARNVRPVANFLMKNTHGQPF
ncbi:MAG: NAD(P)/FAD-dependent oxidoreductase, partial [Bacteroidota bacterium]